MLPYYSFKCVLLHSLLLCFRASSSSVLLCCPHHVDLPPMTANQWHDVTHVGRICGDTMSLPFEFLKHGAIEDDYFWKVVVFWCLTTMSDTSGMECQADTNGLGLWSNVHERVVPTLQACSHLLSTSAKNVQWPVILHCKHPPVEQMSSSVELPQSLDLPYYGMNPIHCHCPSHQRSGCTTLGLSMHLVVHSPSLD